MLFVCLNRGFALTEEWRARIWTVAICNGASAKKMAVSLLCQSSKCMEHVPCPTQVVQFQYGFLYCGNIGSHKRRRKKKKKKEGKQALQWEQPGNNTLQSFQATETLFRILSTSKATLKQIPLGSFTTAFPSVELRFYKRREWRNNSNPRVLLARK